jgi:hypothetical protein
LQFPIYEYPLWWLLANLNKQTFALAGESNLPVALTAAPA